MMVAPTLEVPVSRRPVRSGWKPRYPGEFPTLGWGVLEWTYAHLPSPADERMPFRFTDEQARRVLHIYRLDPATGKRLCRRCHEEEAKGWGKSPEAGNTALAEFCGPVLFDGWDADGQPVGKPWGSRGTPQPWIQIAAMSEAQTENTWHALFWSLTANDHKAADALRIDVGLTLLRRFDMESALMEKVTASAGTREGQPITHAVVDEPQLLTPQNGGDGLARTILRNLTKTGGWAHFTGNAPLLGKNSVAETFGDPEDGVLHFATRPPEEPKEDWPVERKQWAIGLVYRGVPWIDQERVLADALSPAIPWSEKLRFTFNWRDGATEFAWMPADSWAACIADDLEPRVGAATFACVRIAHDHRSGAVAYAQRLGDRIVLRARIFTTSEADEPMDLGPIETYIADLHRRFPARVIGLRRFTATRPERPYPMQGPEIAYHGSFFERSAQTLKKAGMALIDIPNSQERIAPASEQLMELVLSGKLAHGGEGDDELTTQVAAVEAEPAVKGWKLLPPAPGVHIEAAIAAMFAVQRAVQAPREPSRALHRGRR